MRRNDYDVVDNARTTDPAAVAAEVIRIGSALFRNPALARSFAAAARMYSGEHRDYLPCDTDIQHVLDVTLTMARMVDGYAAGATVRAYTRELGLDDALRRFGLMLGTRTRTLGEPQRRLR